MAARFGFCTLSKLCGSQNLSEPVPTQRPLLLCCFRFFWNTGKGFGGALVVVLAGGEFKVLVTTLGVVLHERGLRFLRVALVAVASRESHFALVGWFALHTALSCAIVCSCSKVSTAGISCSMLCLSPLLNCTRRATFVSLSPGARSICFSLLCKSE